MIVSRETMRLNLILILTFKNILSEVEQKQAIIYVVSRETTGFMKHLSPLLALETA